MIEDDTQRLGGCQCGAVRYAVFGPIRKIYVCHCNECRKQSASAFGVSVFVARAALRVTRGTPRLWARSADSGRVVECAFCPDCGSRLWHQRPERPDTITVKAGSLDDPVDLSGAVHIWTSRKLLGVILPEDAVTYPQEPDSP
jgi:hypothetical protein